MRTTVPVPVPVVVVVVRSRQLHGHRAELLRVPPTLLGGKNRGTARHQPTDHGTMHTGQRIQSATHTGRRMKQPQVKPATMPKQIAHDTPPEITITPRTLHAHTMPNELREATACRSQAKSRAPRPVHMRRSSNAYAQRPISQRVQGHSRVSVPHTSPAESRKHSDAARPPHSTALTCGALRA